MRLYSGWDVGGAHLKMATIDTNGCIHSAAQWSTPLWLGMESLKNTIQQAQVPHQEQHARNIGITMTGELVDRFNNRRQGVIEISRCLEKVFDRYNICFYAGSEGFLDPFECREKFMAIASANWYATTSYVASLFDQGILFDLGSTTADIIPFAKGQVLTASYSDHERMMRHELCYTGVVRTPLMAVVECVPWRDAWCPVMKEQFASMADVYRITGELPDGSDMGDTCDGSDKDVPCSIRRLARMIGIDIEEPYNRTTWQAIASFISQQQQQSLQACVQKVIQSHIHTGLDDGKIKLIGAGCGRFLIRKIAYELQLPYVDFESVLDTAVQHKSIAADCATAVSVAQLLRLNT